MKNYNIDKDIKTINDLIPEIKQKYDTLNAADVISRLLEAKAKLISAEVGMHGVLMAERMEKMANDEFEF